MLHCLSSYSLSNMVRFAAISFKLSLGLCKGDTMHFKGQINASINWPNPFWIIWNCGDDEKVNLCQSQILEWDYKKWRPASSLLGKEITEMDAFPPSFFNRMKLEGKLNLFLLALRFLSYTNSMLYMTVTVASLS